MFKYVCCVEGSVSGSGLLITFAWYKAVAMVNFTKELENQHVPEWQEAYCNYADLKRDLRRIHQHRTMGATYTRSGKSLGLLRSVASIEPRNLTKTLTRTITRTFSRAASIASPRRSDYMPSFSPKSGQSSSDTIVVRTFRLTRADAVSSADAR